METTKMRSIRAVAVNTIRQALRLKIAVVFILLLLILLPTLGLTVTGDQTIKGRLQTFLSYGLSLISLMLCLLTIIVTTYSVTTDIAKKQIYTVLTKPIRRYQLLIGKLLGVILLDAVLLILFAAILFAFTKYIPYIHNAEKHDLTQLNNEFYTARTTVSPPLPDITDELEKTYKKILKSNQVPAEILQNPLAEKRYKNQLAGRIKLAKRAAAVGHAILWEFENVNPEPNHPLFLKYKYDVAVNPPDLQIFGRWEVGDFRQYPPKFEVFTRRQLIRTTHELQIPPYLVSEDGYFAARFINLPLNNTTVIFPTEEDLQILYKAGSFNANFARAILLIFFRLFFLACLAVFASTFLSFPVAILLCLTVFFTAAISGFILESFDYLTGSITGFYSYIFRPAIQLIPKFDIYNPAEYLVTARLISWPIVAEALALMVVLKALSLFALAMLIFKFKEIAKIIV